MRGVVGVVGVLLLASAAGCADDVRGEVPCTLVGSVSGLTVAVAADLAPVRDLRLRVCVDGRCTEHRVRLEQGTSAGPEECSGEEPDAVCSTRVTPDGSQVGSVDLDLPEGPVEVSGRYRQAGSTVDVAAASVEARTAYPNGPDCGAGGTRASVTIDGTGLH